jgi:chromosome segregation ATPase
VKPTPPTPPHPLEAVILEHEANLAELHERIEVANCEAFRCYENMFQAMEGHEEQLRADKRQRDAHTEENRGHIQRAQERLDGANGIYQLEVGETRAVRRRLDEAQTLLRDIRADRCAVKQKCQVRMAEIHSINEACTAAQLTFQLESAELQACKQKKIDHINSLDQVKEQVRRHQGEEASALHVLKARKANIHDLNSKIDTIRRGGAPGKRPRL